MNSILPITNIINVTITDTPQGFSTPNVNSLALFTNETANDLNPYDICLSSTQVGAIYGTSSVTKAMADAIFSQSPNILSGGGQLVVIPLLAAVSATTGHATTPDISANLATLIAVSAGDLKVTIDSVAYNLTGLNFTACTTLAQIAAVLQQRLVNGIVTSNATTITITSKKVGTVSMVTMGQVSGGTGTDLSGTTYFHTATEVATTGANSSGETIQAAIARTSGIVGYTGVITNIELEDTAVVAVATAVQALDNIFIHQGSSTADIAGLATTITTASDSHTRILVYTNDLPSANLMKAAYAGRGFSVDFTGSNTSQTMNLKALATINPDTGITQTNYNQALIAGADLYVNYAGVPSVLSTGANHYFDEPYADLALKFALETAGFNFLRQTNTKVPQTEQGMNGLKAAYAAVLDQFVTNGSIAPNPWNSSETFGDPQIFLQNILTKGYYIYSLPIAQQNASDRTARKAPLVQIAIKRAGAIHTSNVLVVVDA